MVLQSADGERHHSAPMLFGLRAVMLGRQGSGKGTQGLQLARLLVVPHISVGDVLREAVRSESPAGRRAQQTMERGELVDDDLVVSLVAERLGIFWMEDEKGPDAKIICVPLGDPRWDQVPDLGDMPTHLRSEIHHFFDVYKALEPGKSTSTTGFEGREAALGEIAASQARLAHQHRTGLAASQEVPREAVRAVGGGLLVDVAPGAGPSSGYRRWPRILRAGQGANVPGAKGLSGLARKFVGCWIQAVGSLR